MAIYDLIVLGGGPGGYLAAERAAQDGMKVALVEKAHLGGTCLNEGCIPTKTLLNSAKLYRHAMESAAFGVTAENVKFDHEKVIARKQKVVKTLVGGVGMTMAANKVTVVTGNGRIAGRKDGGFAIAVEGGETVIGKRLCIAAGSEVAVPPIPGVKEGLESGFIVTSREVLEMTKLPKQLAVIGGGVIGLEMACYFASVGVKVTVIEMMNKIAGPTDNDICNILMKEYGARGMEFKLSCKVLEVTKDSVVYEEKGEKKVCPADCVLLCAGRRPAPRNIGLETLDIACERGALLTDDHLCTNVAGVYAVGDCNGKIMLAHTAYREAEVAVNHMLGKKDAMRYDVIPSVIYTDPEVACVGETKESAEKKGLKVKEVTVPMLYAGRYVAEVDNGPGFCKLVIDVNRDRLIGVHIVGSYASEMIYGAAMMLDTELSPERLQKIVFPHPTVSEVIREALFKI